MKDILVGLGVLLLSFPVSLATAPAAWANQGASDAYTFGLEPIF